MTPDETSRGGRLIVRLGQLLEDRVDYEGTISSGASTWSVRASIALPGGAVEISATPEEGAPEWLVKILRATLRAAFRASATGTPWPRRINRWREGPDGPE